MTEPTIEVTDETTPEVQTPDADTAGDNKGTEAKENQDALGDLISITENNKTDIDEALKKGGEELAFGMVFESLKSRGYSLENVAGIDLLDNRISKLEKGNKEFVKSFVTASKERELKYKKELEAQAQTKAKEGLSDEEIATAAKQAANGKTGGGFSLFGGGASSLAMNIAGAFTPNINKNLGDVALEATDLYEAVKEFDGSVEQREEIKDLITNLDENIMDTGDSVNSKKTMNLFKDPKEMFLAKNHGNNTKKTLSETQKLMKEKGLELEAGRVDKIKESMDRLIEQIMNIINQVVNILSGGKKGQAPKAEVA